MRRFWAAMMAVVAVLAMGACAKREVVEIKENIFMTQIVDIYRNPKEYIGKELHLEGLYVVEEKDGAQTAYVRRYGPSCCVPEKGTPGFELAYAGEAPGTSEWVEVRGVLQQYKKEGEQRLRLKVSELTVKQERGEAFVTK